MAAQGGSRYECPFCGARSGAFLPFGFSFPVLTEKHVVGGGLRPNALCPHCRSLDRERLVYLFLKHRTDVFASPKRLLHVAPEAALAKVLMGRKDLDYVSVDVSSVNAMETVDVTAMRFPDGSIDAVLCNHVLEHVADDRRAMAEIFRVLRPGGWAVVQVPLSLCLERTYEDASVVTEEEREAAFGQFDHVRIYGADFGQRLGGAGFRVEVFRWVSEPDDFGGTENRYGLNREEPVFLARKPD